MALLHASKLIPAPGSTPTSAIPLRRPLKAYKTHVTQFLRTLYLFTANDILTFIFPTTLFSLCGALSGPVLSTNASPSVLPIVLRIPGAVCVLWINLLIFTMSNQRHPAAIREDQLDKPYRPIPSGRISSGATQNLLLILVPIVAGCGWYMGVWQETLMLFTAQWMYNDLRGSDAHFLVRNLLNSIGYGLYSAIALRIMIGAEYVLKIEAYEWIGMIMLVMFFTQYICDIKDIEGDRSTGRKTVPIVLGDQVCRWAIAIPVVGFSVACPTSFHLGVSSYIATVGFGFLVALRTLVSRHPEADKSTWKLWALWTCSLFVLPLTVGKEVYLPIPVVKVEGVVA
ncbi:hypothetical protein P153DRAFT_426922 [Dothidotthia symphoricarpi CBS 119687]|uniref:UbiA prenyltransferase n=1 Tax=Dothidotthia symphoricarpi CBS 119687 TaxID=1392245 RepID=A0A6A5ZWP3_9PLEO|nr:uncharacterized protein P153DRAFT_426922 [Dothidotthia symphoricarpi CBS 119687]KAF2123716.1 hypothetical protein P153DRAFT_426922 [Dothidotthia symphoricarpi CBS 119687]